MVAGNDTSYVSTWANNSSVANIVVGCESCHGPGSLHPANAFGTDKKILNPAKLTNNDRKMEVCGQCHFRGFSNKNTFEYPWNETTNSYYTPGTDVLAGYIVNKPGVWPDNVAARQHHQQYQELLTSAHYKNSSLKVNCFTCHDPHQAPGKHQVRDSLTVGADKFKVSNNDNTLCLACHAGFGPFAGVTKAMVKDPVANKAAIGAEVRKHTHHPYDPETSGNSRCSLCHMTTTAITAKAYDIHTHTFDVIPPQKTLLYKNVTSPTLGMLNACAQSCHRNATGDASLGVGTDATLTNWTEATDIALATELQKKYGPNGEWWKRDVTTGVADQSDVIPADYALSQNFPNPFNPTTSIRYSVKATGRVTLKIYNMLGREVATMVDHTHTPGAYLAIFEAEDLAAGVYVYRLSANGFTATKKMLLVK